MAISLGVYPIFRHTHLKSVVPWSHFVHWGANTPCPSPKRISFLVAGADGVIHHDLAWWLIPLSKWVSSPQLEKWINLTYPIYNWGYNPLTKWDEPPSSNISITFVKHSLLITSHEYLHGNMPAKVSPEISRYDDMYTVLFSTGISGPFRLTFIFLTVTFNTPPGPHPPRKSPQGPWWHLLKLVDGTIGVCLKMLG